MRRPTLRVALGLGTATILTLAACSTTIVGTAAVDSNQLAPTAGSSTPSSSSDSSSSSSRTTTSPSSETVEPSLPTGFELPSDIELPTDIEIPTDLTLPTAIPLPTDIELPSEFGGFSTELPASWPSGIAFPEGTTIYGAVEDTSGTTVVFDAPVALDGFTSFFDAQLVGQGYSTPEYPDVAGVLSAVYSNGSTEVEITAYESAGATSGIVVVRPAA